MGESPFFMITYIIIVFFICWFVLTCLHQFSSWTRMQHFLFKIDVFHILPSWTFFAPNPGVSDFKLLYRTEKVDGSLTSFTNIDLNQRKGFVNTIWNPQKRSQKALSDYVQAIKTFIRENDITENNKHSIKLTLSYINLLHYCKEHNEEQNFDKEHTSIQFMIIETFGFEELSKPILILNSDFHKL